MNDKQGKLCHIEQLGSRLTETLLDSKFKNLLLLVFSVITNTAKTHSLEEAERIHTFRPEHCNSARSQLPVATKFIRCPVKSKPCRLKGLSGGENKRHCNILWRQNKYDIRPNSAGPINKSMLVSGRQFVRKH